MVLHADMKRFCSMFWEGWQWTWHLAGNGERAVRPVSNVGLGIMEASHGVYTAEGGVGWLGWLAVWENGDGTVVDGV